jgi:hypothetical protein
MPDFVKETFESGVHHGGHDDGDRALRYLEWTVDPDPTDTTYTVDFSILLREGDQPARMEHESHIFGLFPRLDWMRLLRENGFEGRIVHTPSGREVFSALRRL